MAIKQARALIGSAFGGVSFSCGAVIEADSAIVADLEKAGIVDSGKDAVAFAKSFGGSVVRFGDQPPAE